MAYRGEDLDLRTPQTWNRPTADFGETTHRTRTYGARGEPIWVDDTVLACCNLAFDLAVTHRAGEVRIEHLIYALTRIDAAAEALESRGVRVAALRREIGSIVAGEIPIGLPNGKGTPRRAEEMEILLRDAAEIAHRRNQPASVDDLVTVLIEGPRDLPGTSYVRRHFTSRLDRLEYEPLRPREPAPRYTPPVYETRTAWAEPGSSTRTDVLQNSRIEALEQAVRSLGTDLANERKTLSGLLSEIHRDIGTRRDEDSRFGGNVIDRLAAVEIGIEKRLADISRTWPVITERLQMLDASLHKLRSDGGSAVDVVALHDRLTGIERAMQSGEGGRLWSQVLDRLKALETTLLSRPATAGGAPIDLTRLTDRLDAIEQVVLERASDASVTTTKLNERLKAIEDGQTAQKQQAMQLSAGLAAEVSKLATTITQMPPGQGGERMLGFINERFQQIGAMIDRQRAELAGAVATPVGERLTAIGATIEQRQQESLRTMTALSERVAAIERGMTGYMQKVTDGATAYDEDLGEIQDALTKINTHQQTYAAAFDHLRQYGNELGVIGNRLTAIERMAMRPAQAVDALTEKLDLIYRLQAEKIEKRNRFYYWLFGTNSWYEASYPDRDRLVPPKVSPPSQPGAVPRQPAAPQGPRSVA